MTDHAPRTGGSLIERAADVYDFTAALRGRSSQQIVAPADAAATLDWRTSPIAAPAFAGSTTVSIDRERLRDCGFIVPEAAIGTLAEEFRLVKRQLLLRTPADDRAVVAKDRMVLVCSAHSGEGKTFCAVNLALSLATERDTDVLLVDADVAKPGVLATLGLDASPGLIDAIADEHQDVERLIVRTDIPKFSVLPSGTATNADTELLSSARAAAIIQGLAAAHPQRIVILDSAPALAASPAAVLAHRVGRILMVVRADRTSETDLREAIALLDGCPDIALLLNGTSFFGTNRKYGSYYGLDKS